MKCSLQTFSLKKRLCFLLIFCAFIWRIKVQASILFYCMIIKAYVKYVHKNCMIIAHWMQMSNLATFSFCFRNKINKHYIFCQVLAAVSAIFYGKNSSHWCPVKRFQLITWDLLCRSTRNRSTCYTATGRFYYTIFYFIFGITVLLG
jgi:hypothetical protein